ncbi:hypothetical protein AGDE_05145 [Angomonas deanei]|nr:hypothetical protein AGDE_05145 [Angomonas deanei]|eukprot:EPY38784.1 hypothetical protein AGDE_05145 [Angomonas deanei]
MPLNCGRFLYYYYYFLRHVVVLDAQQKITQFLLLYGGVKVAYKHHNEIVRQFPRPHRNVGLGNLPKVKIPPCRLPPKLLYVVVLHPHKKAFAPPNTAQHTLSQRGVERSGQSFDI